MIFCISRCAEGEILPGWPQIRCWPRGGQVGVGVWLDAADTGGGADYQKPGKRL